MFMLETNRYANKCNREGSVSGKLGCCSKERVLCCCSHISDDDVIKSEIDVIWFMFAAFMQALHSNCLNLQYIKIELTVERTLRKLRLWVDFLEVCVDCKIKKINVIKKAVTRGLTYCFSIILF